MYYGNNINHAAIFQNIIFIYARLLFISSVFGVLLTIKQ